MRKPNTLQEWLGRHMAASRTLAGLSQQEMANRLGVRQPYVTQLERGHWVNIDPYQLLEYVRLGLDVSEAFREWDRLGENDESESEPATLAGVAT